MARPHGSGIRSAPRAVARVVKPPSGTLRPWLIPGGPTFYTARWRRMLSKTPVVTGPEFAARWGVREIEEIVACDLCGEPRFQPLFHPYAGRRRAVRYHVVRCPTCGFLYRQPGIRPERLGELYAGGYGSFLTGKYARKRRRRYKLVMDAFAPLFEQGGGRRLLDFGCGAGLFLQVAHRRGFETYGVDLAEDAIEQARTKPWGAHTYAGAPLDVPEIAAGGFDVITLWSVLAHLPRPVEDFTMLRSLLAPDGVLLILTVNANSLYLKATRDEWNGFTPNHLKFFSPTTLPLLLDRAGFAAATLPPMLPDSVAAGRAHLRPHWRLRLQRSTEHGNTGNMLRAVAFNSPDGPERWGLTEHLRRLGGNSRAR